MATPNAARPSPAGRQFPGFGYAVNPHAKTLAASIYRAELEVFDGAHLAIFEQPDRANRLIGRHAAGAR
ncbi:MAG: hypothetical protein M3Y48_15430 [Actinomycetota bacterium]|nr:hypothetical protein [Actinomycetota bacterium]